MRATLGDLIGKFCEVYIDDILVYSLSLEDHEAGVKRVFDRLREFEWTVNFRKCIFGVRQVEYLGHTLLGNGLITPKGSNMQRNFKVESLAIGMKQWNSSGGHDTTG
jgi:hypothetical protein